MSKKLTFEQFRQMLRRDLGGLDMYNALQPYLADEQAAEQRVYSPRNQSLFDYLHSQFNLILIESEMDEITRIVQDMNPTKPEPSRLEVAAMIYAANYKVISFERAVNDAEDLIKQSKL